MFTNSLWGEEFNVTPSPNTKSKILQKANKPKKEVKSVEKLVKSKSVSLFEKLELITSEVNRVLGVYKNNTQVIKSKEQLHEYISKAIDNKVIAIDTETNNSLDPLTCKLMGGCIYTPGQKNAYIPINHVNPETEERLEWQCTEQDIKEEFSRLSNTFTIFHNAKFDYEVIKCTCDLDLRIDWDTMIGAKILNENEPAGLKIQYIEKIDSSIEKYSIDNLFTVPYKYVNPEIFALYAATDSFMTYELYKYQLKEFTKIGNEKLFSLFNTVEMPVIKVCADMELTGICLDLDYCKRIQNKYHLLLDNIDVEIQNELINLDPVVSSWRATPDANFKPQGKDGKLKKSKSEQLASPPDINSPTQLAILLYDILGQKIINKDKPRSTGKEELEKMNFPIVKLILKRKKFYKMITGFIDVLPEKINPNTGRLHAHFNQLGTEDNNVVTGRFSCTEPNLQQIPSKNKEIRLMFSASPGYMLIGSDYSAQEPRLLSEYSKEPALLDAFKNDRDVYATLGAGVYKNDYWDNMEHDKDGNPNVEGKNRRKTMKTLLLGMMYGMGPQTLSERMNVSLSDANKIIEDFHNGFPEVSKWIEKTHDEVMKTGYVEDLWGRRRRLPDVLLPEYSLKLKDGATNFNPLLKSKGVNENSYLLDKYTKLLQDSDNKSKSERTSKYKFDRYEKIKSSAASEGVIITKNGGFISRSMRQSVNAKIQGGAATMTKKAMIAIHNDDLMKKYDFKLLIGVHDELIGECREEYANECAERLVYLMKSCVPDVSVALKCDPTIEKHWAEEDYTANIIDEYSKHNNFIKLCMDHSESTEFELRKIVEVKE